MCTLLKYRTWANLRDVKWVSARCGALVFGVIVASLYANSGSRLDPKSLMDTTTLLFMLAVLPGYAASGFMPSLIEERPLFYREQNDGAYDVVAYLLYKFIEEMIIAVPVSLSFSAMVFYAVGLPGSSLYVIIVMLTTMMVGVQLAYLVAAIAPSMNAANTILPLLVTTMLFFTGLLRTISEMPSYWRWFADAAFVRYTWNGLMLNSYGPGGTDPENPPFIPSKNGVGTLDFFELSPSSTPNKWMQLLFLSTFFFGYLILTWLAMKYVRFSKR